MKQALSSPHWRFMVIGGHVPPLLELSVGQLSGNSALTLTRMPGRGAGTVATMPSTHLSLRYHLVFSTKNRVPNIAEAWRGRLHAYLGGVVRNVEGVPEAITEDSES